MGEPVWDEDPNRTRRKGYQVRAHRAGRVEQERLSPSDEPGSQESPSSHPQWQTHL